jgi:hypothetical protein
VALKDCVSLNDHVADGAGRVRYGHPLAESMPHYMNAQVAVLGDVFAIT